MVLDGMRRRSVAYSAGDCTSETPFNGTEVQAIASTGKRAVWPKEEIAKEEVVELR